MAFLPVNSKIYEGKPRNRIISFKYSTLSGTFPIRLVFFPLRVSILKPYDMAFFKAEKSLHSILQEKSPRIEGKGYGNF